MSDDKKPKRSYYEVLGVEPTATQEEIKAAYRKYASWSHPDRNNGERVWAQEVNEANDCLSDPERRKEYDAAGVGTSREILEEHAKGRIMEVAANGISAETIDLLMYIRLALDEKMHSFANQKNHIAFEERKARRYLGKIKRRSPEKFNFIEVLIRDKMHSLAEARSLLEREVSITKIAIELLNDFEYDPLGNAEVAARKSAVLNIGFENLRISST